MTIERIIREADLGMRANMRGIAYEKMIDQDWRVNMEDSGIEYYSAEYTLQVVKKAMMDICGVEDESSEEAENST